MTETTTVPSSGPDTHPADRLMSLIVALLAPLFLGVSGGDIRFARMAAAETVNAYRTTNQADLIAVAQIIGFGLAALGSLSLSMADDLSISMILRLRGNANALNRSAEQNRHALKQPRPESRTPRMTEAAPEQRPKDKTVIEGVTAVRKAAPEAPAPIKAPRQAMPVPATTTIAPARAHATDEQRNQALWANAMADVAGEITASLPTLPPAERKQASMHVAALTKASAELLAGNSGPKLQPGALSGLIRPNPA